MTDKQAAMDALQRLPDNASLAEITEELQVMEAIRRGRADIAQGRARSQKEVKGWFDSWASEWTSR